MGGGTVTVIHSGASGDQVEVPYTDSNGVTYSGTGTVDVSGKTAELSGNISVEGSTDGYTFNLSNGGSYTFGSATVTVPSDAQNVSLTSTGSTITVGGQTYSTASAVTLTADGSGGVSITEGTYTELAGSTFTIDGSTYTSTSAITYNISNGTTSVWNASGTRGFESGDKQEYGSDTYNVTAGTYSITISEGSGTAVLDSGTATKIFSAGQSFSYNSHNYTAETPGVTYNISITNGSVTGGNKSGSGTRNDGTGTYTYSGDEYTLSSGAIMKLTFGANPEEEFYSGSATRTTNSYTTGDKTYTSAGNLTLTLTKDNGGTPNTSLTNGTGTRTGNGNETFTYPPGNGGKSYSGDVTYTLAANAANESLLAGTGTRTDISGDTYAVGNNTYNLTEGTYSLTFDNANYNVTPTLTSATGTTTKKDAAFTIKDDSKTYTPLTSATLNLSVSNNGETKTESFTGDVTYVNSSDNQTFTGKDDKTYTTNSITYKKSGSNGDATVYNATGTRAYEESDNVSFNYQGNSYTVTAGTYTYSVTNGTGGTPSLTTTTAVFTTSNGDFTYNNKTYKATTATTFTLNSGNDTPTMSGEGTRTAAGTEKYTSNDANNGGEYTLASTAKIKWTSSSNAEDFYSGSATLKTNSYNDGAHTYTTTGNNLELTWSKSDGTDNGVTFTSGTGTRTDTSVFTYANTGKTYTPVGNATYTLTAGQSEKLYSATGTRTIVSGEDYSYNEHSYKLTSGTYQIDVANGSTTASETFINGSGSGTVTTGTFTYGGETCTPLQDVVFDFTATNSTYTETFKSGSVTYQKADNTFTAKNDKTYTSTGANVTYKLVKADGGAETMTVYSATGTRAFGSEAGDSETDTYNGDSGYNVVSGTYTVTVTTGGEPNETLTKSLATYSVSNGGTFHFGEKAYTATAATKLTLGYDANGNKSLTAASGAGTRTAAGTETDTYSGGRNNGEYTLSSGAKIKLTLPAGTEDFYSGSATRTTNSYTHTNDKVYTGTNLTLTWFKDADGDDKGVTFTSGTGTRADSNPFVFSGKTYTLSNGGQATYTLAANESDEQLYAAEGTRSSDGNDKITGNWGNEYTIPAGTGTVSITVSNGTATDTNAPKVTAGTATNTYTAGTFKYGTNQESYTVNKIVTLSLSATSGNGTETFESGSAQKDGTNNYIVKGGSVVTIGGIDYTASGSGIVTVNDLSATNGTVSGNITGAFTSGQSATIGDITYTSTGATSLEITDVDNVTANGTFEATGDFSTARTLNSQTLNVTGDTDVKATFGSGGVTKIENLSAGATVVNAGGATTVITNETGTFTIGGKTYNIGQGTATFTLDGSGNVTKIVADTSNGSFQFGSQTFTIADDATEGVTFTIDPTTGTATKIEGLQRTDATYAHVTVTDGGETTELYIRRDSDDPTKTNGKWTDKDIVNFYVVTYDGTFKVQAVDKDNNSTLVNITTDDYTTTTGTPPTLTFSDTTKQIVVKNSTSNAIKVGALDGEINNTGGNAIRIDTNGDFKIGTFSGITFTESLDGNFDVSEKAEFTVTNDGKIEVSVKNGQSGMVEIEAPTDSNLHIKNTGTFRFNGGSIIKIDSNTAGDVQIKFNSNGSVAGIKAAGACQVTVMPSSSSSFDLAESADTIYNRSNFYVEDNSGNIVYVIVRNDDNDTITYETGSDGRLTALSNIGTDASVLLTGDIVAVDTSNFTINDNAVTGALVIDTAIKLNSTTNAWTCGDTASAQGSSSNKYTVEIGNDNKILLYVNGAQTKTQTKNVADYKAVFGEEGPQPTKDDGDLPTYPAAGITFADASKIDSLKITPPTSASSYKIQGYDFTISGETKFTPKTNQLEVELKVGATVVYNGATFTSNAGTSKLTVASSGITLDANAKVTNVSGKSYTAKSNVIFDNVTVTGLDYGGTAVTTNADATALTVGGKSIAVTGDQTYTIDAKNSKITGISNGAQVTANGFEIETDAAGTFKVGSKDFVVAGDDKVTFKTDNTSGAVTKIADLSAAGSITGDFSTAINVNADSNAVNVTGDTNIGVVGGNSTVSKIYNVTGGANVKQAGGAATISTDGAGGTFTFGAKTYSISAGTADFLSSGVTPAISGIKNISGSATVSAYQAETGLAVNGNSITFTGSTYGTTQLKLAMGGDTISTVEGLANNGAISGLSAGAVVKGTAGNSYTINTKAIQITGSAFEVHAAASGYSSVTGVGANATYTTVDDANALLVPSAAGTYNFGDGGKYYFSAVPTLKASGSDLKEVIGLSNGQSVQIFQAETGLKVGNDTVILTRNTGTSGVKLTMENDVVATVESMAAGDAIKGLNAGTVVKADASKAVTINDAGLTLDKNATVYAAADGYSSVTGVGTGAKFTAVKDGAIIIPDATGNYIFGDKTYTFDAKPTLVAGASSALDSIGGLTSGQSVTLYKAETALKVGNNTVKFTRTGGTSGVKLTMGGDTIATVESMADKDAISGLTAGAVVKGADGQSITVNTKAIQITGSDFSVHAAANGYSSVTGIADGATFNNVADANALLIPSAAGTFTFNGKAYEFDGVPTLKADGSDLKEVSLGGGKSVILKADESGLKVGNNTITLAKDSSNNVNAKLIMSDGGNVASVEDLQGEISGLNSGVIVEATANKAVKINTADLQVNQAVTAHVKDSTGYDYVTIKPDAAVTTGKNVSFITNGVGTYTFPSSHKFEISGDTEVTIKTGDDSAVTDISGVTDASIKFGADETALNINGKSVQVNAGDVLKIDGNGVVAGFEGAAAGGGTYNLPANVTIAVLANPAATINEKELQVTGISNAVTVHTKSGGYDWVSGIKTGANVAAVESVVSLITDGAGTFIVDGHTYTTDDAQITLKTGDDGVTEIAGLDADKYLQVAQAEDGLIINGKAVTFDGATSSEKLKLTVDGNGIISKVENLRGDISGLTAGALVQVKATSEVNINDKELNTNDGDVTVHATADGYDYVTGLSADKVVTTAENVSLVTDGAGKFIVGGHTYTTDDAQITLKTGDDAVTEIAGLDADKYLQVAQDESGLKVGNNTVILARSNGTSEVKLTMGVGDIVASVEDLANGDVIKGLTAGTVIKAGADISVGINDDDANLSVDKAATVYAATGGYSSITGVAAGAKFTTVNDGAIIIPSAAGTFTFGDDAKSYEFSVGSKPTLVAGANSALASIGGLTSGQSVTLYKDETALKVGKNTIALTKNLDTNAIKLTMGGDTISTVEGLLTDDAISGLTADAIVKGTAGQSITVNTKAIQITGSTFDVHAAANGYSSITGIAAGATFNTVADANALLVPNAEGTYKFGDTPKTYTFSAAPTLKADGTDLTDIIGLTADQTVTIYQEESGLKVGKDSITLTDDNSKLSEGVELLMNAAGNVATVKNLQDAISGLTAGALVQAMADNAVKINGTDELQASQDVTVRATAAAYDSVTGFTIGATFSKVKNGVILIPDTAGASSYTFGAKTYSFSAKPTLVAGASNALASIGGLTDGQYVELQAADELYIGANRIGLAGTNVSDKVKFVMGDNNTVKTVENLQDSVSGLSAGALVQVAKDDGDVGINNKALNTTDGDVTVHATAGGYDYVTGLSNNAVVTTAQNVSLVTDGAGTYTFGDHVFETDDAQITLKTNGNSVVTEIAGLDADKYLKFLQDESGLKINDKAVTFTVPDENQKLKLTIGNNSTIASVENLRGNISGLTAGAIVDVAAGSTAKINTVDLRVDNQNVTAHVKDSNGYDYVTIKPDAEVTTGKSVSFITDGIGVFKFNNQTLETDDAQITLKTDGDSNVTEIAGLDADKYVEFSQDESGLKINDKAVTFTVPDENQKLKLTIGNNSTIASVENLRGNISGLTAGALVQVTATDEVNINGVALQTDDGNVTVHATADGYDTVTGLSAGKEVTAAKQNATLVTDAAGAFTFETDKVFTITDDNSVAFVMGAENKLAGVYELDGKVSGDFTEGLKVDGRDVLITVDETADILADGSKVTRIEGLNTTGANVQKSGGAETISTGNGTFTFGAKKYNISAGTADFLSSGDVPVISGIKNLRDNAEVTVYQNETALTIEDNTLKISNVDAEGLKLTMNGDTISAVEDLIASGEVSGLSAGANVHVATGEKVTVNGLELQITDSDNAFDVTTAANGYAAITGVEGDNLNVTKAVNASIEITTADDESYQIGGKSYTVNDDTDTKVTLVTDGNTSVTAVGGLIGKLKSDATTNKINGANVYSSNPEVWIVATDDNGISKLTNVDDDDTVSVPAGVEVFVNGNKNNVVDFNINGIAYHLIGESDTISVTDKKIKGLAANARLTISGAEGNYVVNGKELAITPGRNVVIGEATGAHLSDPDAVDFSEITPAEEIIERVFGENVASTIVPVENGSSDQSPGAVLVTQSGGSATLDKDQQLAVVKAEGTVNISSTNDSVVASADVTVVLTGSTNARLMQTAGEMTVNGYDYSTGAGIQISNADVIAAVKEKAVTFGDTLTLDNGATMAITYESDKENIVNLYDITGKKKQTVHYANSNKAALTGDNSANVFVGSWSNTVSNVAINGGSGNDTAFGGAGDTFNLGNGDNYLELSGSNGATVELTATSGNTTVKGFGSSDIVKLNAANAQVYYTADGLIFTNANGQASLSIQDVTASPDEDGANGISYVKVRIDDSGDSSDDAINTAVAREGMAINATNDGTTAYVGNNSGIELNDLSGDIDLDAGSGNFGRQAVTFRGITSIKGGSREIDITGASTVNNTLEAGTGGGSIWGKGAANDLLIAADSDSKTERTTFRFESGDGNDTISNIQFYDSSADNEKMDVVSISGSASTSLSTSGNDVIIKYTDSGDTMTIKDAVNKKFKVSTGSESIVQIARNEVTFDGSGDNVYYYATEPNASLVVSENYSGSEIELKGDGNYTIGENINIVDASAVNGPLSIVGNNSANTLKAGSGGSTLFGGTGASYNDLLIGGAGNDVFRYHTGMGKDTISNVGSGDIINFYMIRTLKNARNITVLEYSSSEMLLKVGTSANSTLKVVAANGSSISDLKFSFQDGTVANWDSFKTNVRSKSGVNLSADLAEDYWENDVYANELLDGDTDLVQRDSAAVTFDNAENISYVDSSLLTGDIQFSVASGEQVYNFSALVDKRNK